MADLFTITGTIEQGILARDAICANYSYDSNALDGESQADFAKRMVLKYIKDNIKKYRVDIFEGGRQATIDAAESEADGVDVT